MTIVYAGWGASQETIDAFHARYQQAATLIAFPYFDAFDRQGARRLVRSWCLDSGAFSAFNAGMPIGLEDFTSFALQVCKSPRPPAEVFALDVIGDHEASLRNAYAMKAAGVDVIPTFHIGEPWEVLDEIAENFDKIALGGVAKVVLPVRKRWIIQCFERVWPKKIHGFGIVDHRICNHVPFHSIDATTWVLSPAMRGHFSAYSKSQIHLKGLTRKTRSLLPELDHLLRLERDYASRWARQLRSLETQP